MASIPCWPNCSSTPLNGLNSSSRRTATRCSRLTEHPSSILVCEHRNGTVFERLDPERLTFWLEAYRLGEVWRIGELGGNP
ncbi:MAG: hypothetical protein ACXVCF_10635 [Isosphaeraceae bacterium]